MFKAYIYILLVQLLVLAIFASKPEMVDLMQEIRDQGFEFDEVIGINLPKA